MTYSEFETRFNNYFSSISEQDISALKTIFYGRVYPTMSTEEKRNYIIFLIPNTQKFILHML